MTSETGLVARDAARFESDGFLVVPDMVDAAELEHLRSDADSVFEHRAQAMVAVRRADDRVTWWRLPSGRPYVLKIKPVLDIAPAAHALAHGHRLTNLAAALLGGPPELMEDKFMYKQELTTEAAEWATLPVLGEEVRKHTDAAYFAARGYGRVLTVAICLDDCTPESGALRVWPGTHRRDIAMVPTDTQGPVVPDDAASDKDAVLLAADAGTVLAWDAALVHASGPNTSGHPRRLLVLGYTATSA